MSSFFRILLVEGDKNLFKNVKKNLLLKKKYVVIEKILVYIISVISNIYILNKGKIDDDNL